MIDESLVAGSDYRVLENDRPQYLPAGRLLVPLAWLRPNPENPREIDDERAANLRVSIAERPEFLFEAAGAHFGRPDQHTRRPDLRRY